MKISVLIHNLNRASALQRCLSSVARLTYRPLEVVILEAGSIDDSAIVIQRARRELSKVGIEVEVVLCQQMGVAASRNLAACHASGELLCFIDNDAAFASADRLRQVVDKFSHNNRLGLVAFQVLKEDTAEVDPVTWVFRRPMAIWSAREFNSFVFVGTGFCIRATAFREVGGFWDHLRYSREEEDLGIALVDKGWEMVYLPTVAIRHYPEGSGRLSLAERRVTELRNGLLVLWHRLPMPIVALAMAGRICTMTLRALREKTSIHLMIRAVSQAAQEWSQFRLRRSPVALKSAWRYAVLHVPVETSRSLTRGKSDQDVRSCSL